MYNLGTRTELSQLSVYLERLEDLYCTQCRFYFIETRNEFIVSGQTYVIFSFTRHYDFSVFFFISMF